jgi:hypothetical protein
LPWLSLALQPGGINFKQFARVWKVSKEDYAIVERFFDVLKKEGEEDNIHFQEWAVSKRHCVGSGR